MAWSLAVCSRQCHLSDFLVGQKKPRKSKSHLEMALIVKLALVRVVHAFILIEHVIVHMVLNYLKFERDF